MQFLIKYTFLSILVFFAISFCSILPQIHTPFHHIDNRINFEIGFPFTFYYEMQDDCPVSNLGWRVENLLLDCFIIWVIILVIGYFLEKRKTAFFIKK